MKTFWEKIFGWLADVAGIALVVLMCITSIDVVARNAGLFSIRGAVELSTVAIVLIGFLGLAVLDLGRWAHRGRFGDS
jgi:TRAP-type C4-dicarboxylate transport system permease small subunit